MADTAALVVALSAQVSKFEKDMQNAVKVADVRTKEIETRFSQMNRNIEAELSAFISRYTSQAGSIGNVLMALGPVGITLAAGIGAATLAIGFLNDKVEKFVEKQKAMRETAEITGLTLDQLKAIGQVATKTGVDFEKAERGIIRMAVAIDDLRSKGTGPLADTLNKLDPRLTKQLILARDTAEGMDILANAMASLEDEFKRAGAASDVFGKRNIELLRVFQEIQRSGGLEAIVKSMRESGKGVDKDLNERLVNIQREIDKTKKAADNMFGSAFAEFQKGAQLDFQKAMEFIAKQTLSASTSMGAFVAAVKEYISTKQGLDSTNASLPNLAMPQLTQPFKKGQIPVPPQPLGGAGPVSGISVPGLPLPQARPSGEIERFIKMTEDLEQQKKLLADNITFMERWAGVLGDAVKPAEQYQQKQIQINKALLDYKEGSDEYIKLQEAGARSLEKLNEQQTIAAIAIREQLGVATEKQILDAKQIVINQQIEAGIISGAEAERARTKAVEDSKKAYENMLIAASRTPELTRFALEGADSLKQFSQLAINAFGSFENAIADVVTGTTSLQDAFKKMADAIIRDLIRITLRMAITAPLANALGGLFGGGGLLGANPFTGGLGKAAGGPVNANQPYVVGEKGPELFVPKGAGTIIPSPLTPGRSVTGSTVEINNYVANDTETKQQTMQEGPGSERIVIDIVRKAQARGEFDPVNRARFGLRPNKVR